MDILFSLKQSQLKRLQDIAKDAFFEISTIKTWFSNARLGVIVLNGANWEPVKRRQLINDQYNLILESLEKFSSLLYANSMLDLALESEIDVAYRHLGAYVTSLERLLKPTDGNENPSSLMDESQTKDETVLLYKELADELSHMDIAVETIRSSLDRRCKELEYEFADDLRSYQSLNFR